MSDPTALAELLRHCHRRRYPKGAVVFRPGDPGEILHYLESGSVSITLEDPEGREIILGFAHKGDFIGEVCVFTGAATRRVWAKAREDAVLAEIGYGRLELLLRSGTIAQGLEVLAMLGREVCRKMLDLRDRKLKRLIFEAPARRVLNCLIDLCAGPDAITHPEGMQLHVSRQEIGRMAGVSREVAGQVLRRLEEEGALKARGMTIVMLGLRPGREK